MFVDSSYIFFRTRSIKGFYPLELGFFFFFIEIRTSMPN